MNKIQPETAFSNVSEEIIIEAVRGFPLMPDYFSVRLRFNGISVSVEDRYKKEHSEKYFSECCSGRIIPFSESSFCYKDGFLPGNIGIDRRSKDYSQQEKAAIFSAVLTGCRPEFLEISFHDKFSRETKEGFELFRKKGGFLDALLAKNYGLNSIDLWVGKEELAYYYWREHEDWSPFVFCDKELKLRIPAPGVPAEDRKEFLEWKAQFEYELNKIVRGVGLDYC